MKSLYTHLLTETEQTEAAGRLFNELAASGFAHPTHNVAWLFFAAECAWLAARLGRPDYVPELRSRLQPYAGQLVVGAFAGAVAGSVAYYLGLLATTAGDWAEADHYFSDAATTHQRISAPVWLAHTRLEWARMLLTRAEAEDAEKAEQLLHQALATARELELGRIERDAVELLAAHP